MVSPCMLLNNQVICLPFVVIILNSNRISSLVLTRAIIIHLINIELLAADSTRCLRCHLKCLLSPLQLYPLTPNLRLQMK